MAQLTRAHQELYRRSNDERFSSLSELAAHCHRHREQSVDRWERPQDVAVTSDMTIGLGNNPDHRLNDWSFGQLCRLAGVGKDTINRLSSKTAAKALEETLPSSEKPVQFLTTDNAVRSVHGIAYTRLWNEQLVSVVQEFATDFTPPQEAQGGGTGLYCGEQDMFCFLIDPAGWTEIDGENFAPGFFVFNSEVGRRSLGIQTFWFQAVCRNHIVWDACEVVELKRKHTAGVHDGLDQIRRLIEDLVAKRDARRDGFARVIRKAMDERLGSDAEEVAKVLGGQGIPRHLVKDALKIASEKTAMWESTKWVARVRSTVRRNTDFRKWELGGSPLVLRSISLAWLITYSPYW